MFFMFVQTTQRPSLCSFQRFHIVFITICQRCQFIISHMYICAYSTLYLHTFFGTDKIILISERIMKMYTFLTYMSQSIFRIGIHNLFFTIHTDNFSQSGTKRHDLKAAGIGHGRPIPSGPSRKSALFCDFFGKITQVIAVAQHCLCGNIF